MDTDVSMHSSYTLRLNSLFLQKSTSLGVMVRVSKGAKLIQVMPIVLTTNRDLCCRRERGVERVM